MSNALLAFQNRGDASTLSNGSWVSSASISLNNLKDPNLDKVARSTNAVATSTMFAADLGANFPVRAIALVNHNMSVGATWQVKGGTVAPNSSNVFTTGGVFDSGVLNVLQMSFNWDAPSNWGATYMAILPLATQTVRYITVNITDTGNAAGYVQLGRLFVATGFQPGVNFEFGQQDAWADFSTMSQTHFGKKFWNKVPVHQRMVDLALPVLTGTEPAQVHEMEAILGLTDEVLYLPDPADTAACQRYGFLGGLRELTPLENPMFGARRKAYRLEQKL